ncbi:hypothetical protein ABL840_09350 [Variovorax sp. NFACC27]|uniref:hypothetical protein n=1 Tax=unclassified Variovorax TaxID=663243 RepID=UPI0008952293|nr:hypothetical protein [Variovorax paradoxus]SEF31294.1 hypothetical protein SAMN03159371_05228 [Variovorax sp. NFACC28]SEG89816.1 hypothetical protein SAMN03159365_05219 [Variovorax sp. NFACC29]SFD39432.1 hypothetical protein SAMN03159379_05118 [Variovorax sp. NFACC26]SFG41887.1 hypothetical protein SAMN03159447_03228 [Variovorax sp. NFACC27]
MLFPGQEIVKAGVFLYDGEIECDIRIIRSPVRFGTGDREDEPHVRDDVEQVIFYVQYGSTTERGVFPSGSGAYESLQEAMTQLAAMAIGPTLRWAT